MALSVTNRLALSLSGVAHGTGSFSSSSFTPANGKRLLMRIWAMSEADDALAGSDITITDSMGPLTWTLLKQTASTDSPGTGHGYASKIVLSSATTSGSSMTVTLDAGTFNVHRWGVQVDELDGEDASPLGATAIGNTVDVEDAGAITLDATPLSTSIIFAMVNVARAAAVVPGSVVHGTGWTEEGDQAEQEWFCFQSQRRTGYTGTSVDWDDLNPDGGNVQNQSAHFLAVEILESTGPTPDQEGFAFGDDDGNEAAHTLGTQDTDYSGVLGSKTLRLLLNATGDPFALAYTLRYQKNGSGGYAVVPIGGTTKPTPVIETADCTVSGNNTAQSSWAVSHPTAATGDLLIFYIAWDDSTATTDVTEPSGANGETLSEINATPVSDSGTETRAKAWYTIATGAWSATTKTFTPSATESWSATCIKVLAGEFDAGTPIGAVGTASDSSGGVATAVNSPAFSAGASDGGGKLVWCAGVDVDPLVTLAGGWTSLQTQDLGALAHGVAVRDAAVTNSESISSVTWSIAGDSWTSLAFVVRAPTVNNQLYVSDSANVTSGGEGTTARLAAPSGKTTGDFVTGRRWDNENGTDTIDITTDDYTEVEWTLTTQSPATNGDYFDFRVYSSSSPLSTYTVTPRWTIGSNVVAIGGSAVTSSAGAQAPGIAVPL